MFKKINFNSAISNARIGGATKARVRVQDGQIQVRFTDRTSLVNLPKTEEVRNVGVKGSGRVLGLPTKFADVLPEPGTQVALVPGKYGWFTLQTFTEATNASLLAGRVSA
jgi:hypothetical protein